ncbi:choice-of-anchor D domain-containing protein [Amycolatopsis taiwanensis]|uniref:choice-of-anchor D domain-containing protein n=1 Tax=Amycolatopsis taiwanensis TaxID=342230 RepID=UPI002552DE42|nr:choice-of-anchor D domain-containing protein [Amycolatopsis taiwanensis]
MEFLLRGQRRWVPAAALAALLVVLGALLVAGTATAAPTGRTERVSVGTDGGEGPDGTQAGEEHDSAISADGRYVAFLSRSNLAVAVGPEPHNEFLKLYVRDRQAAGRTVWIDGPATEQAAVTDPTISADGRFIGYTVRNRGDSGSMVYLYDRDADHNEIFDEPGGTRETLVSGPAFGLPDGESADEPALAGRGGAIGFTVHESPIPGKLSAHVVNTDGADLTGPTELVDFGTDRSRGTGYTWRYVDFVNDSATPVTLTGVTVTGRDAAEFQAMTEDDCRRTLRKGESCRVYVTFSQPPIGAGRYHAVLSTTGPERHSGTSVGLAATRACQPNSDGCPSLPLTASPNPSLSTADGYGQQQQSVMVTNNGSSYLSVASALVDGSEQAWFRLDTTDCLRVLAPGDQCLINYRFQPTGFGLAVATLVVEGYSFAEPPPSRQPDDGGGTLDGTGAAPEVLLDNARLVGVATRPVVYLARDDGSGRFDDAVSGPAKVVSVNAAGTTIEGRRSSVSADARFAAFDSIESASPPPAAPVATTAAVSTPPASCRTVYRRDTSASTAVTVVSRPGTALAAQRSFGAATQASISADGSRVGFTATVVDVADPDPCGPAASPPPAGVFVRDLGAGATVRGDRPQANSAEPDGSAGSPALSADGRTLAFASTATNLVPGDTNISEDAFVRDLQGTFPGESGTPFTERVSVDSDGNQVSGAGGRFPHEAGAGSRPQISAEGRYVSFTSFSDQLVSGDTNDSDDVFVRDRLPVPVLAPIPVTFAETVVGESSPSVTVTLRNDGTGPLAVSAAAVAGPAAGEYHITANGCTGQLLHRGASCPITVVFAPTAAGDRAATLTVSHSAPGSPAADPLQGTGVVGNPVLAPDPLDFGGQTVASPGQPRTVTVANTGNGSFTVTGIAVQGPAAGEFSIVDTGCQGVRLAPGASCPVRLRFTPATLGARNATLRLSHTAPGAVVTSALTGTGTPMPVPGLGATPNPADLGDGPLGLPGPLTRVTVTSAGSGPVTVTGLNLAGPDAGDFQIQGENCIGITLAPAATCTVDLRARAGAVAARSGELAITSSAAESPLRLPLRATGRAPALRIDPVLGPTRSVASVTGTGFPPGAVLTLRWANPAGEPLLGSTEAVVRPDGGFTAELLVFPKDRIGPRVALTSDPRWGEARTDFLVVPAATNPPKFVFRP